MNNKINLSKFPLKPIIFSITAALTLSAHATTTETTEFSSTYSGSSYTSTSFIANSDGSYTIGTSQADFDTVIYLYAGSYDSSNSSNYLTGNDDSDEAQYNYGLTNVGTCSTDYYCSEVTTTLTTGQTYTIFTRPFGGGTVTGTVWYYVIGDSLVTVIDDTVYGSSLAENNSPALNAARVIDANSNLSSLFVGVSGDQTAISNAATQTLPLMTGGAISVTRGALTSVNNIVDARISGMKGQASGDDFYGNKILWMKPFATRSNQNTRDNVAGYKAKTYGVVFGTEKEFSPALNLGLAYAHANSNVDSYSSIAPQHIGIKLNQFIAYGSYALNDLSALNFQVDYGKNINNGTRQIELTSSVASSSYKTETAHVGINADRDFMFGENTTITPAFGFDYTWIKDHGYSETGADDLNLVVDSKNTESFVIGADTKFNYKLNSQTALIADMGVGYDAINEQDSITAAFAGAPGASFVTYGIKQSPWIGHGGFGVEYKLKNGLEIVGRYDLEGRQYYRNQTVSANLKWPF